MQQEDVFELNSRHRIMQNVFMAKKLTLSKFNKHAIY